MLGGKHIADGPYYTHNVAMRAKIQLWEAQQFLFGPRWTSSRHLLGRALARRAVSLQAFISTRGRYCRLYQPLVDLHEVVRPFLCRHIFSTQRQWVGPMQRTSTQRQLLDLHLTPNHIPAFLNAPSVLGSPSQHSVHDHIHIHIILGLIAS